jgi:hypothetical protein
VNGYGQVGTTAVAELLARRWNEDRPYFILDEDARGVRLQARWLRGRGPGGLEQHWYRLTPAQSRHSWECRAAFRQYIAQCGTKGDFFPAL